MEVEIKTLQDWLKVRPECVQKLAAEFPLGTEAMLPDGRHLFLLGYTEDDMLIMSEINPYEDYHGALENKTFLCAAHLRGATKN